MLLLVALWLFDQEPPEVLVFEVGIGGRYDATNIIPAPAACGVCCLDLDHVNVIGHTLELIAHEKGGIFKPGVRLACATPQAPGPLAVLQQCAQEAGLQLQLVQPLGEEQQLGLQGEHQRTNAALAVALCAAIGAAPEALVAASLANTRWPGRCERVQHAAGCFLVDGAHTPEAMRCFAAWASRQLHSSAPSALLFYCGHERDPVPLLQQLLELRPCRVFMCTPSSTRPSLLPAPHLEHSTGQLCTPEEGATPVPWADTLAALWAHLSEGGAAQACSVSEALSELCGQKAGHVLCVGSLYLAGEVLLHLQAH
eukprot:TRINITY_DN3930_c0_g1_i1.p1 TRINITY_DN3930_c0_g1~~TRINITY_DN3930_c0_g1_i1.p1  ORF type:complete len:312 (+),score=85.39 TRINITY_DN3930_c0_g1_i1:460-1395(+)